MSTKQISVILPAYNESARIARVLELLREISFIQEILVVNDGSTDHTEAVVKEHQAIDARISIISNPKNLGKGQSVYLALQHTSSPFILMLDADLKGLEGKHIHYLCDPVMNGNLDMTVGQFRHGTWASDFSHWVTPWLSGQRCIRRELFNKLNFEASAGYGIETVMTITAHQQKWRTRYIPLIGVSHPPSEVHRGSFVGIINRIKMYLQIIRAWYMMSLPPHQPQTKQRQH